MTTDPAVPASPSTDPRPVAEPSPLARAIAIAVPVVAGLAMAVARWSGGTPFGSDNDEYRLLADALGNRSIEIGGVEGTKYPVGYSAVLEALDRLHLPMTGAALVLNLVLVAVLAALIWRITRRYGGILGASVAATMTVLSLGVWDSVYVTMPDLGFLVLVAATVALTEREPDRRRVVALVVVVAGAVLLKSVGLILGVAVSGWLLTQPRWRRWSWTPAVAAFGLAGLQAAWSSTAPEHTTGYNRTFWLTDPYDASLGSIGVADLPSRMWHQADQFISDVGAAAFGAQHVSVWLGIGAIVLVAIGAAVLRDRLAFSATFFVVYSLFLLAWPYSSPRFGLAFLPWAAVGAGATIAAIQRRTNAAVAVAVAVLLLVPYAIDSRAEAVDTADAESAQVDKLEVAVDDIDAWLDDNTEPGDLVASPDYRELAYRTDREYLPVPYTSDTDELWRVTGGAGAEWLVVLNGIYPSREKVVAELVASRPDQVVPVVQTDGGDIYRICPEQACA